MSLALRRRDVARLNSEYIMLYLRAGERDRLKALAKRLESDGYAVHKGKKREVNFSAVVRALADAYAGVAPDAQRRDGTGEE